MHTKSGTRRACKQKKKRGGEVAISTSTQTHQSIVGRPRGGGSYYSDVRCDGTAGSHESADVFLSFSSCRTGVRDTLLHPVTLGFSDNQDSSKQHIFLAQPVLHEKEDKVSSSGSVYMSFLASARLDHSHTTEGVPRKAQLRFLFPRLTES